MRYMMKTPVYELNDPERQEVLRFFNFSHILVFLLSPKPYNLSDPLDPIVALVTRILHFRNGYPMTIKHAILVSWICLAED